ncbi:MAG: U32 family peptidase [Lachnospiraceae bacterium]|nr:U32 family peptidase [Lachnospiraceae bacterium]
MEILAPAGNYKSFIGAINAGCDAVYLGGSKYGARAYADNFTDEEIVKAIKIAHLYGKKVYLTVNTLIKEKEFNDVCEYIKPFYKAGLDACIVQDLGLISVFSKLFPDMECHVSTQALATGLESVREYKKLGASRVVLARELSLKEIKNIKENEDIEIETFIHGAMCYSYSGACLFSSCLGGRSGNRGRCAGPCRLPYKYVLPKGKLSNESYFLSMKDQCTIESIPDLVEAKIDSLKIEGRMKKPEYTAFVTAMYRKYIDRYLSEPKSFKVDKKDLDALKHIYLRSEIGTGYYYMQNGKEMICEKTPGYMGNDENLMTQITKEYVDSLKKIKIDAFISVLMGQNISLTLTYGDISVTAMGDMPSEAITKSLSKEDISKQISKLGDTCFVINEIFCETDNESFVPVKALNELRREAVSLLEDEMLDNYRHAVLENRFKSSVTEIKKRKPVSFKKLPIIMAYTKGQIDVLNKRQEDFYLALEYENLKALKAPSKKVIMCLPFIARNKDRAYLKEAVSFAVSNNVSGIMVQNFEEISAVEESDFKGFVIYGPGIYAFNKASKDLVLEKADSFIAPYELSRHEIADLDAKGEYVCVYGKLPLMQSANCVAKTNVGCLKDKGADFSYIVDRTNAKFCVYRNCNLCYNTIFNSVPTCLINEKGIDSYKAFLSFVDENEKDTENICDLLFKNTNDFPKEYTKAYWNRGVE